jgi:hypothetical protein
MMGALELAGLVDEWWYARRLDMADEAGVLDGGAVLGSTHVRSHLPSGELEGGSRCPAAPDYRGTSPW